MRSTRGDAKEGLRVFVRGLSKEQADHIMNHLPQLIALIEGPTEPCPQESFPPIG